MCVNRDHSIHPLMHTTLVLYRSLHSNIHEEVHNLRHSHCSAYLLASVTLVLTNILTTLGHAGIALEKPNDIWVRRHPCTDGCRRRFERICEKNWENGCQNINIKWSHASLRSFTHIKHTGWAKKTAPNFSCNNFGKYGPILIMFSLLHSQMNWKKG